MLASSLLYQAYEFQRHLAKPVRLWANTLEQVALGGRDAFYRGDIARQIEAFCERVECYLRYEDFAAAPRER